jgi:hypothetical protein
MALLRLSAFPMDAKIISSVIGHDNDDRLKHHSDPITLSYGAGLLYRSAKLALLRLRGRVNLPLATRETIYDAAKNAASQIGEQKNVGMTVKVAVDPIRMPRQLGFEKGSQTLSLKIDIAMDEKLPEIPG